MTTENDEDKCTKVRGYERSAHMEGFPGGVPCFAGTRELGDGDAAPPNVEGNNAAAPHDNPSCCVLATVRCANTGYVCVESAISYAAPHLFGTGESLQI